MSFSFLAPLSSLINSFVGDVLWYAFPRVNKTLLQIAGKCRGLNVNVNLYNVSSQKNNAFNALVSRTDGVLYTRSCINPEIR